MHKQYFFNPTDVAWTKLLSAITQARTHEINALLNIFYKILILCNIITRNFFHFFSNILPEK